MVFQLVHLRLLVVAQIAYAESESLHRHIECELLPQRGRTERCGGNDIMVVVTAREDLIVALSVVRTEHQTQQRSRQLITKERLLAEQRETPDRQYIRTDLQVGTGLCRVVGITGVIQEANAPFRLSACLYPPAVVQLPTMSDGISGRDESTEFVTVISPLRCILERY